MLITRPEADSLRLKPEIEALGFSVMIEPLLTIEAVDQAWTMPDDVQLIALTSANAVQALTDEARTYPIYAVGESTAAAARAVGCRQVHTAKGNVENLTRLIVESCRYQDGCILHLSGEVIREGLAERLDEHGFRYRRRIGYRAIASEKLSDDVIGAWQRRMISAVLLFSPRTAEILVHLLSRHGLQSCVDSAAAICLSDEAAAPCKGLSWKSIRSAARPNRQALITALVGSTTIC
ncbi:MAG: uroporphyrinogen-III synthase [Geminicoccaceae bacterium]